MPADIASIAALPGVVAAIATIDRLFDAWFDRGADRIHRESVVKRFRTPFWLHRGYWIEYDEISTTRFVAIGLPSYEWGAIDFGNREGWLQRIVYWEAGRGWRLLTVPCNA